MLSLRFQFSSSLSLSAVTWQSSFLSLIYHITLTTFVTQIRILWPRPQGLNVTFAKYWQVPPLFRPPPFSLFLFTIFFSPHGPKPAKHVSKWQLPRLASKKPWVVDFPCLMWHLWLCNRIEGERLYGTMLVCLGDGGEGVKNQNVGDTSTQQIDTGPLIRFFFSLSFIWASALQMEVLSHWLFSKVKKWGARGRNGRSSVPTHRPPI